MAKAYTKEEFKQQFLEYLNNMSNYWLNLKDKSPREVVDGVIFSILVAFDGEADMPAMDVVVSSHPTDKQYYIDNDEDYYEDGTSLNDGDLHEKWAMSYMKK